MLIFTPRFWLSLKNDKKHKKMSHKKLVVVNESKLSEIINIVIASSKIQTLKIPSKKIRAQLHTIIYGGLGGTKTDILWEISKNINLIPTNSFGAPHIYGTVDKMTGIHTPPMVWDCRNSCLLVDDFVFDSKNFKSMNTIQALLPILEHPHISKRIGYRCNEVCEKDEDLYLKVKDGKIDCTTRFSLIMNTMTDLRRLSSHYISAFTSRCLIIPHYPNLDDLRRIARGGTFYEFKKINVKKNVEISKKNYNIIINFVDSAIRNPDSYLRTIGDCCRVYAVLGKHNKEIYNTVVMLHNKEKQW